MIKTEYKSERYLPTPRLQLRWAKNTEFDSYYPFVCYYEMVLSLGKYDIRNERTYSDYRFKNRLYVRMNFTLVRTEICPTDTPYRDGAHVHWDNAQLGTLPVFVVRMDGTAQRVFPKTKDTTP